MRIKSSFELDAFHRNVSNDDIIADLKRVACELQKPTITFREYNKCGKYHSSTVALRFGTWLMALKLAKLDKIFDRNIASEQLFRNIVDVWGKLGRQPRFRDLSPDVSAYSASTYAARFGSWRKALAEFLVWAKSENVTSERPDHIESLSPRTPRSVNWRLRAQVLMRDEARCRLCGVTPSDGAKLHVDHIQPWSKGGETTLDNLQILCERCNVGKSDMTR